MRAVKMGDGIYRIGANIKTGDLFQGMWPIPDGVSLNAYVVKGDNTALIDLVRDWGGAPDAIREQLSSISLSIEDLDYMVMNHIEPDHSGWLHGFLKMNPQAQIFNTKKEAAMVKGFFGVEDNVRVIASRDTLALRLLRMVGRCTEGVRIKDGEA